MMSDNIDQLYDDACEIMDSVTEAYFDGDTPEGETIIAQAAAAHAWFLICMGHLPEHYRHRAMMTGQLIASKVPIISAMLSASNPKHLKA